MKSPSVNLILVLCIFPLRIGTEKSEKFYGCYLLKYHSYQWRLYKIYSRRAILSCELAAVSNMVRNDNFYIILKKYTFLGTYV